MKINVAQLKQEIGGTKEFSFIVPGDHLDIEGDNPWSGSNVQIKGEIVNNGRVLELRGSITAAARLTCSRCLENTVAQMALPFAENYVEAGEESDASDYEFLSYAGDEIDLTELVRENLLLAEPLKTVCDENCKGLCPSCGTNLNNTTCSCDRDDVDPRLAVLKSLLQKKE